MYGVCKRLIVYSINRQEKEVNYSYDSNDMLSIRLDDGSISTGDDGESLLKFAVTRAICDEERCDYLLEGWMTIAVAPNGDMTLRAHKMVDGVIALKMKDGKVVIDMKPNYDIDYVASKLMESIKGDFSK